MQWKKLGRIFSAEGQREWMHSHIQMPVCLHLDNGIHRVYFGTRNSNNHPHVGFIEFDINQPHKILCISDDYVLGPGPLGYFDDNGLYPGSIIKNKGKLWLYYMGRSNGANGLYYMAIGLAVSSDGGNTFQRYSDVPIMTRSKFDPWMVSTPHVTKETSLWRMYYLSGIGWEKIKNNLVSFYNIKYAESNDGVIWEQNGTVAIDFEGDETNIAAPCILKNSTKYEMWYCYAKHRGYRLGYAISDDGISWIRKDGEIGISLSDTGWDSESMAYPNVFKYKNKKYMLYSGNSNGKDGIGLAMMED
ncbi:hypothetical protein ACFL5W_00640 [Thermodesulfobacteriota bacterium]